MNQAGRNGNRNPIFLHFQLLDIRVSMLNLRVKLLACVFGQSIDVQEIAVAEIIVHAHFQQVDVMVKSADGLWLQIGGARGARKKAGGQVPGEQ